MTPATTYKGETVGKALARCEYWLKVEGLNPQRFPHCRFLVLCSRECGDVSALVAMGVPQKNITAVDIDAMAIEACRARFPEVDAFHGALNDLPVSKKFEHIFLDTCSNVGKPLAAQVARTTRRHARLPGTFGVGYMRGRERRTVTDLIATSRAAEEAASGISFSSWGGSATRDNGRMELLHSSVTQMLRGSGLAMVPAHLITYSSMRHNGSGAATPMSYTLWVPIRPRSQAHAMSLFDAITSAVKRPGAAPEEDMSTADFVTAHMGDFVVLANHLRSAGMSDDKVAGILNVTPGTLAARRAHATRGTYKSPRDWVS